MQQIASADPKVRVVKLGPIYDCRGMCQRTETDPGNRRRRAAMRCSLPDFDPAAWDPSADKLAAGMAEQLAEDILIPARQQGLDLDFDLDTHGCIQGWALSRFGNSVALHIGTRDADSEHRQPSYRMRWALQQAERPDRLIAAVELAEAAEDGCYRLYARARNG